MPKIAFCRFLVDCNFQANMVCLSLWWRSHLWEHTGGGKRYKICHFNIKQDFQ